MVTMKNILSLSLLSLLFVTYSAKAQEVTGLSDWQIFLDPGHSQTENMGLYSYSEAEKTLRVALNLRELLATQTDIETVYMSRDSDNDQVGLSQRTDLANSLGPDFYYSIHSDAGGPDANSTLMLYGGWRQNGETVEKSPKGGQKMGAHLDTILTDAMRIGRRGNYADRTFYQGFPANHDNNWPYLSVNRRSNMASLLSEAGFHTNPYQQQRNLNAEYKKLEAQSAFWAILAYHELDRPTVGILTGEISDADNGNKLNGATISVQEKSYTTNTYASLFNNHSNNPNQLSNGFYYIEELTNELTEVIFDAPDYYADTLEVEIKDTFLTFLDTDLTSSVAPFVANTEPTQGSDTFDPGEYLQIEFSRAMSTSSVEKVISVSPEVAFEHFWLKNKTLVINTENFVFETEYTVTIGEEANDTSSYKHGFDGDADGEAGGSYTLTFTTGPEDTEPPRVTMIDPFRTAVKDRKQLVNVEFNEALDLTSLQETTIQLTNGSGNQVEGESQLYNVGEGSALTFFPTDSLAADESYTLTVKGHLKDLVGNELGADRTGTFTTENLETTYHRVIDDFDGGVSSWWEPQQSGSTEGIKTLETSRTLNDSTLNLSTGSEGSMQISYGWDTSAPSHLIRIYLAPGSTPQGVRFNSSYTVQAYVFGDNSGNQFRFMLRDGSSQLEGSPWFTINWKGWKLVSWNMEEDGVVGWVNGNSSYSGNGYVDSFQLTYTDGANANGFVVIDDFRIVQYGVPTSVEGDLLGENGLPTRVELRQNYPNPFNPTTNIEFALPQNSEVKIILYNISGQKVATIVDKAMSAGTHTVNFDASALSSGIYIYQMQTANEVMTRKMTLIK